MAVAFERMTAKEYLATPEDRPRTELINGVVVMSEPTLAHNRVQGRIFLRISNWIEEGAGRGFVALPADITIDDDNVFAPDLWWVREERRPGPDDLHLDGVPDLVVEVRSPSTWVRDVGTKLPAYEAAGVAEAWYVDTHSQTVLVLRRPTTKAPGFDETVEVGAGDQVTSPLLPGFALDVGAIFET